MSKLPKCYEAHHPDLPGVFLLPLHPVTHFESAARYKAKPGDLFLCNYPKCGITWLQNIVWRITHKGQGFTGKLKDHIAFLEFDGGEAADATRPDDGGYNIIKTHFPYMWVSKHPEAKYIFIAREPKDVCVSLYYHLKGFGELKNCSFDDLVDGFLEGKVEGGDYFDMLNKWYEAKDDPSILFLLYEDLLTSTKETIMKIAEFLGPNYVAQLTANKFEYLEKIVQETSLPRMQKEDEKWCDPKIKRTVPFVRKGIIGDWKNHMTPSQAAAIDEKLKEASRGNGSQNLWLKWKKE